MGRSPRNFAQILLECLYVAATVSTYAYEQSKLTDLPDETHWNRASVSTAILRRFHPMTSQSGTEVKSLILQVDYRIIDALVREVMPM